jgi:hypothetical protein
MTVFLSLDCFASFPSFKSKKTTLGRVCSHLGCGLSTPVVARPLVSAGSLALHISPTVKVRVRPCPLVDYSLAET